MLVVCIFMDPMCDNVHGKILCIVTCFTNFCFHEKKRDELEKERKELKGQKMNLKKKRKSRVWENERKIQKYTLFSPLFCV